MPEVVRGARASLQLDTTNSGTSGPSIQSPSSPTHNGHTRNASLHHAVTFAPDTLGDPLSQTTSPAGNRRISTQSRRNSLPLGERPEEDVYHDSRAATKREFRRRGTTLQEYYHDNPELLPQLPFTMRHGWRRWKLAFLITIAVIDACVVPIVLYYGLTFGGNVQGWISETLQALLTWSMKN